MQAIVVKEFGGPEVLRVEDLPVPAPRDGEVRVRLEAAGVNPVDAYVRTGTYARRPALPYVPGSDGAGTVDAIGPGVAGLSAGDRVYVGTTQARRSTGTYAEFVVCDATHVHPLPAHVSAAAGAAVGVPAATAYRALFQRARLAPGERVLIHGASGSVGLAAVQLAAAHGAAVIGTAGSEAGRALVRAQGAGHVVDHRAASHLDEVLALTAGRGVDVIVEMLANENLERDFAALAPFGRIVIVGSRGTLPFSPRLTMGKEATILGMSLFNVPATELAQIHAALGAALSSGTLRPVVARELPLREAARAHEDVLGSGVNGKIVLVP
jgi:NADPH2:quinone reductase